jgi:hypothetical protein
MKEVITRIEMFNYLSHKLTIATSNLFNQTRDEIAYTYIAYRQHLRNERCVIKKNEKAIASFLNRPNFKAFKD